MAIKEVKVPDLGGSDGVEVIEIPVKAGDRIAKEETILVLESDKATVEVPAPYDGVIQEVLVSIGDTVNEGSLIVRMDLDVKVEDSIEIQSENAKQVDDVQIDQSKPLENTSGCKVSSADSEAKMTTITIPDLGDNGGSEVIEVLVEEGDTLAVEQTMVVLESDKATMEVPCSQSGIVRKVLIKVGDTAVLGTPVLELMVDVVQASGSELSNSADSESSASSERQPQESGVKKSQSSSISTANPSASSVGKKRAVHAGPAVRRLARELGVELADVVPTGPRQRVLKDDVHGFVKQRLTSSDNIPSAGAFSAALPEVNFSQWGDIETVDLNKINKLSAANLHRSWITVPHVTQFDEADITALERFRKEEQDAQKKAGIKLTILAFLVKACAHALREFPRFNASLHPKGEQLILKKYVNVGIAVDTPNGLVVPVIKQADQKSVSEIALAMQDLSERARTKKLLPADMQGGCFSISSLGGIGGTAFTPIVNWPEVAILGVSRSQIKPVYNGKEFTPRLMLPLSLSYDHRVIDGAEAARFTTYLSRQLSDIRRLLL